MKHIWFRPPFTRQFDLDEDEPETLTAAPAVPDGSHSSAGRAAYKLPCRLHFRLTPGHRLRVVRNFRAGGLHCIKRPRHGRAVPVVSAPHARRYASRRRIARGFSRGIDRYGYYVAVAICSLMVFAGAAAGIAGYGSLDQTPAPSPAPSMVAADIIGDISAAQVSSGSGLLISGAAATAMPTAAPRLPWPLEGDIITPHSTDALLYLKTLDVYGTHSGIDIAGRQGQAVAACADGVVARCWRESLLGNVIELRHADGMVTRYANLLSLELVTQGDSVGAGDVIGAIGASAMSESLMPPHLHFEIISDGVSLPPLEYLQ